MCLKVNHREYKDSTLQAVGLVCTRYIHVLPFDGQYVAPFREKKDNATRHFVISYLSSARAPARLDGGPVLVRARSVLLLDLVRAGVVVPLEPGHLHQLLRALYAGHVADRGVGGTQADALVKAVPGK